MRCVKTASLVSTLLCLAGCASLDKVAVLGPVGPSPAGTLKPQSEGFLQVYSARKRTPIDPNTEEFFWNDDFGRNEFLHYPAHTDYTILTEEGKVFMQVHNSVDLYDPRPTLVALPPGRYNVQARAEDFGRINENVMLSVVIQAGRATRAHLAEDWRPARHPDKAQVVRMPGGRVVGWSAKDTEHLHTTGS